MSVKNFIREMPKVELHVHLEGAIDPETLLILANRNKVTLPADTVDELQRWYQFVDFHHFLDIYFTSSRCLRTPEDIELITRDFLKHQASQNIVYSEVTYTPYTHYKDYNLSFEDQLSAINRARQWAETELGVSMGLIIDISREVTAKEGDIVARWAIEGKDNGVIALGLGGPEVGNPPEKFRAAFEYVHKMGLPSVVHAGETAGPASIWGALNILHAKRIGHGVSCLEDKVLVEELRARQIPLEVCPTSNVCLKVCSDLQAHPLPHLLSQGLYVTINSDDPSMFGTTLTNEYLVVAEILDCGKETIQQLVLNAVKATLLDEAAKRKMEKDFLASFAHAGCG